MYKKLENGTKLFIITKAHWKPMLLMNASCGYNVNYVLIEKSIYKEVRNHKEIWAICQCILIPGGKIEIF
jgi:hypothetical protein